MPKICIAIFGKDEILLIDEKLRPINKLISRCIGGFWEMKKLPFVGKIMRVIKKLSLDRRLLGYGVNCFSRYAEGWDYKKKIKK